MPRDMSLINRTWEHDRRFVNRREIFERRNKLRPELPLVGRHTIIRAVPQALRADAHEGEYELHLVTDGQLQVWIDQPGHVLSVPGGSASLTQPGQRHGGVGDLLYPGRWIWIRFRLDRMTQQISPAENRALREALTQCPPVFTFSPALLDTAERIMSEHRHRTPESATLVGALVVELLTWIIRDGRAGGSEPAANLVHDLSPPIARAIAWMEEKVSEDISVSDVAEAASMSESHFRRSFHAEVGCTPSDYLMRRRIELAKESLQHTARPITELAFDLGFSSSAYFSAVFHKQTGLTPSEYRNNIRTPRRKKKKRTLTPVPTPAALNGDSSAASQLPN